MSVFSDEWRACLREQYKYVVRSNDARTLETLTEVMHNVGFADDELKQLKIQATLRTEDVPEDFQPDLNILEEPPVYPAAAIEETPADDGETEVALTAEDLLAMEAEIEAQQEVIDTDDEADADSADTPDEDDPVQLSLFG